MTKFKSPSDHPWPLVIMMYVASIGMAAFTFSLYVPPHAWSIPAERQLTTVAGHFLPYKQSTKTPYALVTDGGEQVRLGCLPESGMANCLDEPGIRLERLSRARAEVRYFKVPDWRAPDLANVLVTLSADGTDVFTYEDGRKKLEAWSVREEEMRHSLPRLAISAFFPLLIFLFAVWLTIQKRAEA